MLTLPNAIGPILAPFGTLFTTSTCMKFRLLARYLLSIFVGVLAVSGCVPEAARGPTMVMTPPPVPMTVQEPRPGATPTSSQPVPTEDGATTIPTRTALMPTLVATPTAAPESPTPPPPTAAPERDTSPEVAEADIPSLVAGNTALALDLHHQLGVPGENLFFSPYSISQTLAMAYAGASGETEGQMSDTLRFDLPQYRLHAAFNVLDLGLVARPGGSKAEGFRLNIANAVWGQQGHPFLPAYLETLSANYGGEVHQADFRKRPDETRRQINDWVSAETEGTIEDLIAPGAISTFTRLVLANAAYFKADWHSPFAAEATSPGSFYALDGSEKRVPMMRQIARFNYAQGDGYQAVELTYEGRRMSMVIIAPDEGRFDEFENSLDAPGLDDVLLGMKETRLRLSMPRFKLEAAFDLSAVLAAMGMPNAFDGSRAEFQGMDGLSCLSDPGECLSISGVAHQAFVSVDEAGTEAAAATAVLVGVTSAEPEEPIPVTIDRPFIVLIRDRDTASVLFLGRVVSLDSSSRGG